MRRWIRWLPFGVLAIEAVLVLTGLLDLRDAAIAAVVLELLLAVIVIGELLAAWRAYRRAGTLDAALRAVLPPIVASAVLTELRIAGSLVALLRGHRPAPADAIAYGGRLRGLLVGLAAVSVVEVFVIEVVVPWPTVRWILLVLGVYGLFWVAGFAASTLTRPHLLSDSQLRLRFAVFVDLAVPLRHFSHAQQSLRGSHKRTVELAGGELAVSVLGTTNVLLHLSEPTVVDLGPRGTHPVTRIRLYADDPAVVARFRDLSVPPSP